MTLKIEQLYILEQEIENTIDLSMETSLAVDLYRAFFCKNQKSFLSSAVTEGAICLLIFTFVLPISLIVNRAAGNLSNTVAENTRFFYLLAAIIFLSFIALNVYLWQRVKQVESLAKLLEEIARYNSAIEEVSTIEQINSTISQKRDLIDREEIISFLQTIRQSLINALKVEKIARTRKDSRLDRHNLLARLEEDLTTLVASDIDERAAQYQHSVEETLRVGLAVRKEVQKLKERL
ncbi:MAG: hypothetical protein SW833_05490 [Cyanobacteriota bacterium]|nr:hypothetical protein [Cyanobacteriota bacterium]